MAQVIRRVKGAFTLVELVIVIAIIGILAAIAVPRFIDLRAQAYVAARDGVVGGVRAGIMIVAAKNQVTSADLATFPPDLEAAWAGFPGGPSTTQPCIDDDPNTPDVESPCFELILTSPLVDPLWKQLTTTRYQYDTPINSADRTYTYDATTGSFKSP